MVRVDARHVIAALGDPPPAAIRVGDSTFEVEHTAAFGGRTPGRWNPWVRCRCGRRCAVLYAAPGSARFACRACWTIRDSSDTWHGPTRRRRRAWLIRRRLGERVGSFEDFCATGFRPIPPRPAGMWRRTYARLADELREVEGAGDAPRAGRPKGMTERVYRRALDRMARSTDGGAVEAAVMNLSRARLAMRRPSRP